ncbi:hypothetical protein AAC387_Pa08g2173 [Persea americana]
MLDLMRRPGGWVHAEKDKLAAIVKKMNTAAKSRSVMELCDAGVEFRAADEEVVALSSIKFENGVLTLPIIRPSYKFEVLGCNMVAFEDNHGGNLHNAAFCFSFMKGLLTSVEDVRHLRSLKIIQSVDLSDEGILQTFRRILSGKILMLNLFSKLNRVQDQLEEFYLNRTTGCGGRLWKSITSLKQKYFNNPWTFIAVVSAALLLALAMTQTYYTALPYWDATTEIKKDLAIKLNEGKEVVRRWNKNSIYKLPAPMVAVNPEAFTPKMVSMGPYHHGKDQLMPMEVHKHRAAQCFIQKSEKPIEDYIDALWKVLRDLMDSYSQLNESWMQEDNVGRFLELMLIDGCFLLEILHVHNEEYGDYEKHDPIFSYQGTISFPHIAFDLMMLENQVPFTAIEMILSVQNDKKPREEPKQFFLLYDEQWFYDDFADGKVRPSGEENKLYNQYFSAVNCRYLRTSTINEFNSYTDWNALFWSLPLPLVKKIVAIDLIGSKGQAQAMQVLAERLQDQLNDFYMKRKTGCRSAVWEWIASWKLVWIPNLKQKDINNPWTFISVVAATILMALTIAQTYYAARSYWDSNQKKNLRSWFVWECSINNLIGGLGIKCLSDSNEACILKSRSAATYSKLWALWFWLRIGVLERLLEHGAEQTICNFSHT